jgi:glycerol kinase
VAIRVASLGAQRSRASCFVGGLIPILGLSVIHPRARPVPIVVFSPLVLRAAAAMSTTAGPHAVSSAPSADGPRRFVAAIDQGTTSSRVMLFDHDGRPVATCQKEHRQIFPKSAWVEHDPEEIWERVLECARGALAAVPGGGAGPDSIAAVGITNQRETLVVWNRRTGKSYCNAIVWQDQRGAALCESLKTSSSTTTEERVRAKTGLPIVPYFSASKLAWALENVPGLRADAEAGEALFGTIDTFLLWRLTGGGEGGDAPPSTTPTAVHATDVSNASRTLLFNIHTLEWDDELLALFKVPRGMLPAALPSSGVFGVCSPSTPFAGVPIAGILGDQQSALFGQACFEVREMG